MKIRLLLFLARVLGLTIQVKEIKGNKEGKKVSTQKKRGPGRPIEETAKRLSKPVRWFDADYEKVKKAAELKEIHVSEFIRNSSIENAEKVLNSFLLGYQDSFRG